jgi:hypothetical protein
MALNTINPTNTASWKICKNTLMICKMHDAGDVWSGCYRVAQRWNDFLIDYSKNIYQETITIQTNELVKTISGYFFAGEIINQTENRGGPSYRFKSKRISGYKCKRTKCSSNLWCKKG